MELIRHYGIPLLVASLFHGFVFLFLYTGFGLFALEETVDEIVPHFVKAQLIPAIQRTRPTQVLPTNSDDQKFAVAENEQDGSEDGSAEGVETDLDQEELDRMRRFQELQQSQRDALVSAEINEVQETVLDDRTREFMDSIYEAITQNWSRPPVATNEMSARVLVELYPDGEVLSVGIIESSGTPAFDRSAIAAVEKAAPYSLPNDRELYEKRFRQITLNFRPQDLQQ